MSVTVKMSGDDRDLVKAQERVEKGAAQITAEYKKLTKESQEMQRFAKKAWEESLTPLQKYEREMEKLNRTYQGATRDSNEYKAAVGALAAKYLTMGEAGSKAMDAIWLKLGGVVAGYASITTAIQTITGSYDAWIANTNEIANSTRAAMKEVTAFAMMQGPEASRQRAISVATRYAGIMTPGESWDVVQAMQSATGSYEKALPAADWIAEAMRMQVAKQDALETARQAAIQNQDIGGYMRAVAASGEFGIRDAPTMAKASGAMKNWNDKTFGWAAAATLGGAYGEAVDPYLKQAGVALSGVSKAAEWFERQGLGRDATQQQRLEELVRQSKDTVEELADIGLVDAEARDAVLTLVTKFDTVMQDYGTLAAAIADPNFMRQRIASAEAGVPEIAVSAAIAREEGLFQTARSFDREALEYQLRQRAWATELARRGINQGAFGLDLFGETGDLNWKAFQFSRMWYGLALNRQWMEAESAVNNRVEQTLEGIQNNTTKQAPRPRVTQPEQ